MPCIVWCARAAYQVKCSQDEAAQRLAHNPGLPGGLVALPLLAPSHGEKVYLNPAHVSSISDVPERNLT